MVVNLCLPQFASAVHCNKLCADGYDVTNLLSADPAVRRRGFKLEYFLRPPVQVTLTFGFQVEVCRVDVELWPWGMDLGKAHKRLEISTNSDAPSQEQRQQKDNLHSSEQNRPKQEQFNCTSHCSNGRAWSVQAPGEHQKRSHPYRRSEQRPQATTNTNPLEPEFKLVGRCELREETQVCFSNAHFRARPPFPSPPPGQPAACRQEELWSRGMPSLSAVRQLRVTVPFGGAASALGLKALAVWGQPSRCCSAEEVERVRRAHQASQRQRPQPSLFSSSIDQPKQPPQTETTDNSASIPEEFLDPLTQEVMTLPMLLPCGMSVDHSTLDEYHQREATWGRPPSDPFTGVPFNGASQPLPNPRLKSRIDHFILQTGVGLKNRALGRQGEAQVPQPSRLLAPKVEEDSSNSVGTSEGELSLAARSNMAIRSQKRTLWFKERDSIRPSHSQPETSNSNKPNKWDLKENPRGLYSSRLDSAVESLNQGTEHNQPEPKRPRTDLNSIPSSSHEQRLSSSLDEALLSALQGRPSFTSNSTLRLVPADEGSPDALNCTQTSGTSGASAENKTCSACFCSLSAYTTSTSPVYRLLCAHLMCRSCLRRKSVLKPRDILCPTCQRPSSCSDIVRVHH